MRAKRLSRLLGVAAAWVAVVLLLAACAEPVPVVTEVTRVITEVIVNEGSTVVATRLVTETQTIIATATPSSPAIFVDSDPSTFFQLNAADIVTLDPALAYDTASRAALQNIVEGLIAFHRDDPNFFIPALAEAVPSVENGLISADRLTYTFPIRRGVSFHDGGTLEPHDVAYSIRRMLLQSDPGGPAWLFLDPLLGQSDVTAGIGRGAWVGDPEGLRVNATAEELAAACAAVFDAVTYDDAAGSVTLRLAHEWGPFLPTLPWLGIIDQEWAVANGAWGGTCDDWANFYAPGAAGSALSAIANGTGPYRLARWTPGAEYELNAFEGYWRDETTPLWPRGPYGPARIPRVIVRVAADWNTRFAALRAGDADFVAVPYESEAQVDPLVGEICDFTTRRCKPNPANPQGPLRKWDALPTVSRQDIFMNQSVAPGSPYLGSGILDGQGAPPDFFADDNARRAMAACFDYAQFNRNALGGEGLRNNGPIISGMLGYNPDGPIHEYAPEACATYLAAAWGGVLPERGFRVQFVYPIHLPGAALAGGLLQGALADINPLYVVEPVGVTPAAFLAGLEAGQFPMFYSGWIQDVHDPHNWAAPYAVGIFGTAMRLPDALRARFESLVNAGALTADSGRRELIYREYQALYHETSPAVILFQRPSFRFEPRYLTGFYFRLGMEPDHPPFYVLGSGN